MLIRGFLDGPSHLQITVVCWVFFFLIFLIDFLLNFIVLVMPPRCVQWARDKGTLVLLPILMGILLVFHIYVLLWLIV